MSENTLLTYVKAYVQGLEGNMGPREREVELSESRDVKKTNAEGIKAFTRFGEGNLHFDWLAHFFHVSGKRGEERNSSGRSCFDLRV